MSTKIYNGYMIPKALTLSELKQLCSSLQKDMLQVKEKKQVKTFARNVCYRIDKYLLTGKLPDNTEKTSSPYNSFGIEILHAARELKKGFDRNPVFDAECTAVFFPLRGKTLFMLYAEWSQYQEVLFTNKEAVALGVQEYGYWNNTDRPKGVSARNWETRRRHWDIALGDSWIPSQEGLSFKFCGDFDLYVGADKLIADLPTLEERARAQTRDLLLDELIAEKASTGATVKASDVMEMVCWLRDTEEGKQLTADREQQYLKDLEPYRILTREIVISPFQDIQPIYPQGVPAEVSAEGTPAG